jgi:hypothetical protein
MAVTAKQLRALLEYCPATGTFTWRVKRNNRTKGGEVAGYITSFGYRRIEISGASYAAHRLAWLYVHGAWPRHQIDHINSDRADNRIANLRDVTPAVNCQNQKRSHAGSKVPFLGVYQRGKSYRAHISYNGKRRWVGTYATPELAHAAYIEAKRELHPEAP